MLQFKTVFLRNVFVPISDNWPRTPSGLPSTSGTTASIAIIKQGKLYIGHAGDSGIVLGCDEGPRNAIYMKPKCLTKVNLKISLLSILHESFYYYNVSF